MKDQQSKSPQLNAQQNVLNLKTIVYKCSPTHLRLSHFVRRMGKKTGRNTSTQKTVRFNEVLLIQIQIMYNIISLNDCTPLFIDISHQIPIQNKFVVIMWQQVEIIKQYGYFCYPLFVCIRSLRIPQQSRMAKVALAIVSPCSFCRFGYLLLPELDLATTLDQFL